MSFSSVPAQALLMVDFSSGGLLHPIHMDFTSREGWGLGGVVSIATGCWDDHCGCGMISKQMQAWLSNHLQPDGLPQIVPHMQATDRIM